MLLRRSKVSSLARSLTILTTILILAACSDTHMHDYGNTSVDRENPAYIKIPLNERGIPKPEPETVTVYPGQLMEFIAQQKFELIFIGRSPTEPRSRSLYTKYASDKTPEGDYKSTIKVSDGYRELPVLDDPLRITREDLLALAKELNVKLIDENHEPGTNKTPVDTEKYLYIHYLIKIGNVLYDPAAKIIKGS